MFTGKQPGLGHVDTLLGNSIRSKLMCDWHHFDDLRLSRWRILRHFHEKPVRSGGLLCSFGVFRFNILCNGSYSTIMLPIHGMLIFHLISPVYRRQCCHKIGLHSYLLPSDYPLGAQCTSYVKVHQHLPQQLKMLIRWNEMKKILTAE